MSESKEGSMPSSAEQKADIAKCRAIAKERQTQLLEAGAELEEYKRVIDAWEADVNQREGI